MAKGRPSINYKVTTVAEGFTPYTLWYNTSSLLKGFNALMKKGIKFTMTVEKETNQNV